MSKTVLITGSSTGIGRETVKHFQQQGWNVVATMRTPENETELNTLDNVLVCRLDVTDSASIESAVNQAVEQFGAIDALINNAGYGAYGPLETFPMERIRKQFDTNVLGLLETTKAVIPHMRAQKSGVIVNISSIGGIMTFPLGTLYHGTKWAVEGMSEALHYELEAFGVKVKIVEPGMIKTDFGGRSFDFSNDESIEEYQGTVQKLFAGWSNPEAAAAASEPTLVAEVIWGAVTDGTSTLRYKAGPDAHELINGRQAAGDEAFIQGIKQQFGL